ncbi:leucine-rich repeat extensin-like protein 3 [Piliocolobus tephrosceles]|uniref:leucine-rich repeat extensin-like protein 3 n=1 Tax=Piliocolobus tephrosceles TaxID=591936 RepID=UPI000E6B4AE9|nr:leucine-rich repeat extensin-like protein 3 [Piliocolobus tephrosceles]
MTGKLPPISQFPPRLVPGFMIPHPPDPSCPPNTSHSHKPSHPCAHKSLPLLQSAKPLLPLQKHVDFSVFCPNCYPTVAHTCPPHYPTLILYLPCSSAIRYKPSICHCSGPRTFPCDSPICSPLPPPSPPCQHSGPRTLFCDSPICPPTPPPSPACKHCRSRAVSWDASTHASTPPP